MRILHSKRLTLRNYEKSDKEALIELLNDKEVSKWTERIPYPYREKHAKWWISHNPQNSHNYAITEKKSELLVGGINITDKGEIGCWFGRKFWNKGFATEAIERIIIHGIEELKLKRIWAATRIDNKAAFRLMEKTGFSRVKDRPYYVEGIGDTKVRPHFELTK